MGTEKPYRTDLVGRFLGVGGEHMVFAYGDDSVIKFSFHFMLSGKSAIEKKRADYALAEKYFGEYVVPIELRTWSKGHRAVEIQKRVECRQVRAEDLLIHKVRAQVEAILEHHARMYAETGVELDFFGFFGILGLRRARALGNISITEAQEVRIIDFATMHLEPRWYEWPLWLFIEWAKRRQRFLLKKYWHIGQHASAPKGTAHASVHHQTPSSEKRVGLYAWGGPGTIDLLKVKYHRPRVRSDSFTALYSEPFLKKAQQELGVTDVWMTYSWGFGDSTERAHRADTRAHLPTVKKLGLTSYGYVQGLNVVSRDFKGADIFCKSKLGLRLPYSKGRHFICPNNPAARALILSRVVAAAEEEFDNIFMDNILFGLPPLHLSKQFVSSFGCYCTYCRAGFKEAYGYPLKRIRPNTRAFTDVLEFRVDSTASLIREASTLVRAKGKGFGVNLYDPYVHTSELFFGYSLDRIGAYLDYYLIENHAIALDGKSINNAYLKPLIATADKPVFVVSYQHGIGIDARYSQHTVDLIFSESSMLEYSPCVKASEFVTNGVWHALEADQFRPPRSVPVVALTQRSQPFIPIPSRPVTSWLARVVDPLVPLIMEALYQSRTLFMFVKRSKLYTASLRSYKLYDLETKKVD